MTNAREQWAKDLARHRLSAQDAVEVIGRRFTGETTESVIYVDAE